MRVKLLTQKCGPDGSHAPGAELEVGELEGRALVAGNFAVEMKRARGETAALRTPARATSTAAEEASRATLAKIARAEKR